MNNIEWQLASRYLSAKSQKRSFSLISWVSIIGVSLGVLVLITVMSVMNGFDKELKERILGMTSHITIHHIQNVPDWKKWQTWIKEQPNIINAAPYIPGQAMLSHNGAVKGIAIHGIYPEQEKQISVLPDIMTQGKLNDLKAKEYGIILGQTLTDKWGLRIGDKILLMIPQTSVTPIGVMPRLKRFTLKGTFKIGGYEMDSNLGFIHLEDASKLYRTKGPTGIRAKLTDLYLAPSVAQHLNNHLPLEFYASDWTTQHGDFFQAVKLEKTMVFILLLLIIIVAAFIIFSNLVMTVLDKKSDIAILRTIGTSRSQIMRIFIYQGIQIGLIGITAGTILGLALAYNVSEIVNWLEIALKTTIFPVGPYFTTRLPSEIRWGEIISICTTSFIMIIIATIYPAWHASNTNPIEALRHE